MVNAMTDEEKQLAAQHKAAIEHEKRLAAHKPTPTIEEVALSLAGFKVECEPDGSPEQHIHPAPVEEEPTPNVAPKSKKVK
jgi:hypothetical protein